MYPKKQPKSDREKFYGAFQKKVGCKPEQYLRSSQAACRRLSCGGFMICWPSRSP